MAVGNKDDINVKKKKSIKVTSISSLSAYDKALLKFAENVLVGSIDTVKTFSQSMITLVSGMFAVYFAILKFLGIETTTTVATQIMPVKDIIGIPPVLFILSIIAFIVAIMPWRTTISYTKAEDIESVRKTAISIKYTSVLIGTGLFLISLAITISIFLTLLES